VGPGGYAHLAHRRHHAWERGYLVANRRLADTVAATCPRPRAFLVQDYHLYPLPRLLRASFPSTPILHFTHIPFPEVPLMRLLPRHWRGAILRGMLGADCVGLQTEGDVQAFLSCCAELLGATVDRTRSKVLTEDGRVVAVRAYPASVDPGELAEALASEGVAEARRRLAPSPEQLTVIRVDRLDPSKNQLIGFRAFARLLETRPDLRRHLTFLAFLVPSRTDLRIYRAYRDRVYREIEAINARFAAACGRPPIRVFYTNDRDQALAAMECCDALLINSLEDGMNLVAKEWAMVSARPGVLVLSETAGVVEEAADGALLISPLDIEGTAQALEMALELPMAERAVRLARIRRRVLEWTNRDWLAAQLADLGVETREPAAGAAGSS
jgi:trehalose 6-phosphate synthase